MAPLPDFPLRESRRERDTETDQNAGTFRGTECSNPPPSSGESGIVGEDPVVSGAAIYMNGIGPTGCNLGCGLAKCGRRNLTGIIGGKVPKSLA